MNKKIEYVGIFILLGFYCGLCLKYFWIFPAPSDQLEYVQSVQWGTTVGGYWPWLDRISMASVLGFLSYSSIPVYHTAPGLILLMGLASFGGMSLWLNKNYGFGSALFFIIFIVTNYYAFLFGTEVFPEPFIVFFLMIFTISIHKIESSKMKTIRFVIAGFSITMAALCKITVVPFSGLVLLYVAFCFKRHLTHFFTGVGLGLLFVFGHFIVVFGFDSLLDTVTSFFSWNFNKMLKGTTTANNIVSYYEIFTDRGYLPVFLSLLILPGLYRDNNTRFFAVISWILGGTVCLIYLVGDRSGAVIANYVYPMYFFASVALAIHWGQLLSLTSNTIKIKMIAALVFVLVLAWVAGRGHYTSEYFILGYYQKANIIIKSLLQIGVFVLALSPLMLSIKPSPIMARAALILVCFFSFLYNSGKANSRFSRSLHPEVHAQYSNANLINIVPVDEFIIFNSNWVPIPRIERTLQVYTHFFNKKYPVPTTSDRQKVMLEEIPRKIGIVKSIEELKGTRIDYVLTDKIEEVKLLFPEAIEKATIAWMGYDLYLLKIH